jgi:hypothetical protein
LLKRCVELGDRHDSYDAPGLFFAQQFRGVDGESAARRDGRGG